VRPEYPQSARIRHREGTVVLSAIIEADGRPSKFKIVHSTYPELNQSALSSVSQWRYEHTPACSGVPGSTETFIDVVYSLER